MSGCGNNSSGALTEVAAIGAQEAYLCINPEKTFFAQIYRRYTNFAIAEQDLSIDNAPCGAWEARRSRCRVQRNGDMLGWCYFKCKLGALGLASGVTDPCSPGGTVLPSEARLFWTNAVGHAILDEVCFTVGGQVVDRWTGEFMQIWERYSGQPGKYLQEMIGQFDTEEDLRDFAALDRVIYVPIPFYYCRAYALHKPLIALQYHEVHIEFAFRGRSDLICRFRGGSDVTTLVDGVPCNDVVLDISAVTGGQISGAAVTANYVYLDTMERRIMAQQPHEYLITQLQFHGAECVTAGCTMKQVQVHFNHPVIELFWVYQEDRARTSAVGKFFNYGVELPGLLAHQDPTAGVVQLADPIKSVSLQLNGHDRIAERDAFYFRAVQPWERHSNIPDRHIYNYCFALYPEESEHPSGGCNMSRIDNVVFRFTFCDLCSNVLSGGILSPTVVTSTGLPNSGQVRIYARSHNVVKIAGGMLAVRHAN